MYCSYKYIFGKVGEGVHSYRFFNIAIIDVLFTFIVAYLFHLKFDQYSFLHILIILFICGIILHRLFCVRTTIDKLLFKRLT